MAVNELKNWNASASSTPPVEVSGTILRETPAAILIEVEGTGIWFPLSTVLEIHRSQTKEDDRILVQAWIANKKGLY